MIGGRPPAHSGSPVVLMASSLAGRPRRRFKSLISGGDRCTGGPRRVSMIVFHLVSLLVNWRKHVPSQQVGPIIISCHLYANGSDWSFFVSCISIGDFVYVYV